MQRMQQLLQKVAELERRLGEMVKVGTVDQVNGEKLRVNMGNGEDGKPVLGPWIHHNAQRGGAKRTRDFRKGQNVTLINPSGDPRQAIMLPYAPNKDFPKPDHAGDTSQGEENYQLDQFNEDEQQQQQAGAQSTSGGGGTQSGSGSQQGKMSLHKQRRNNKDSIGTDEWIEESQQQQQQGQQPGAQSSGGGGTSGGQQQKKKSRTGGANAKSARRMTDTSHTHRITKDSRTMVDKKGVKMKFKEAFVTCDEDTKLLCQKFKQGYFVDKPWEVKSFPDPIQNDDA